MPAKSKTKRKNPKSLLQHFVTLRDRPQSLCLSGKLSPDRNFPGRHIMILDGANMVSFNESDMYEAVRTKDGLDIVTLRKSAQVWRTVAAPLEQSLFVDPCPYPEEDLPPPPMTRTPKDPVMASQNDIQALRDRVGLTRSIAGAAAQYNEQCEGGDRYQNNCAHFLSDAFIRAGYSELGPPNNCIHARCGTSAKRPIRAKDMWCWFKSMSVRQSRTIPRNKGFWAVFQLDENEYCCGHVVIIDTDNNTYYGTGNYPSWDQYAYQW